MTQTAKCQRTGKKIALIDGFFVCAMMNGDWRFVAADAEEGATEYHVKVSALVKDPATLIDWLATLNEKPWFDKIKFFDFITQLRKDNQIFTHTLTGNDPQ